jgi:hypothetical protein
MAPNATKMLLAEANQPTPSSGRPMPPASTIAMPTSTVDTMSVA